jgi:formylglycine-generating enzyme required for sulfatase activity
MNLAFLALRCIGKLIFSAGLICTVFLLAATVRVHAAETETVSISGHELTREGKFRFRFEAKTGQTYPVEMSADFLEWVPLTNIVGVDGSVWVQDDQATNTPRRYYNIGAHPGPTPITNMVYIAPGTFTMGSPAFEFGRGTNEGPQTVVTLSRSFWIGKYEVNREDYAGLTGDFSAMSYYDGTLPVDIATWNAATNFCHKLNERERAAGRLPAGYVYRLPTEAEWEYVCRAGTTTPVALGDGVSLSSHQANFDGGFPYGDAPSGPYRLGNTRGGTFPGNAWGVYDMHGNVWEWVQDIYQPYPGGAVSDPTGAPTGIFRILRGGGYSSIGSHCRSAKRDIRSASYRNFGQGFRVVLAREF